MSIAIYVAVMAIATYLVRMLPFALFTKEIRSRYVRSFLYYIPYTVLSAMTFPAIFFATGNTYTAVAGTVVALGLSVFRMPLIVVALAAAAASYICGIFV